MMAEQQDLITDEIAMAINKEFYSKNLYEIAKEQIIKMNHQGESHEEMRIELGMPYYKDMMHRHLQKLLWVVDQWEDFFIQNGVRFSK